MIFQFAIYIIVFLLVVVGLLFAFIYFKKKSLGVLSGDAVYTDTQKLPGEILYSETLQLKGKPDYIIKKGDEYIPVEVKTGKTPNMPYRNHVAQLFAYCALIQEKYSVRPKYGVIKYPEQEFEIEYTEQGEQGIQQLISEMQEMKQSDVELQCSHKEHNITSS